MIDILQGDCREVLRTLPSESVHCCVTSPPYFGLRNYGTSGEIGSEKSPKEFVQSLVVTFEEVRRVLRQDGTLWLNLGDSYCSTGGIHQGQDDNQTGVVAASYGRNAILIELNPKYCELLRKRNERDAGLFAEFS